MVCDINCNSTTTLKKKFAKYTYRACKQFESVQVLETSNIHWPQRPLGLKPLHIAGVWKDFENLLHFILILKIIFITDKFHTSVWLNEYCWIDNITTYFIDKLNLMCVIAVSLLWRKH